MLGTPRFWLVVQMAVFALVLWLTGLLAPRESNDTKSYVEASRMPGRLMLTSPRTVGYPLVLKAVAPWSPDFQAIPAVQLAVHFLAVAFLDFVLRRFGATPWQAFAVATGFLYTVLNDLGVSYLLTDSLAKSMAAFTVGFLLWTSVSPRRLDLWIGLAVSLAATYQIRPAYLFLIPLTPLLGIALLRLQSSWRGTPFCWRASGLALCGVALVPFLGFCLLRWTLVGHFGLVSFTGCNLVGVAGEWIDQPMIDTELPEAWRPLAQEILEGRKRMRLESPYRRGGLDMYVWERNHLATVVQIAYPAAKRLYGDDHVLVDRQLSGLSKQILWLRKGAYLRFLIYNLRDGAWPSSCKTGFVFAGAALTGFLPVRSPRAGASSRRDRAAVGRPGAELRGDARPAADCRVVCPGQAVAGGPGGVRDRPLCLRRGPVSAFGVRPVDLPGVGHVEKPRTIFSPRRLERISSQVRRRMRRL